MSGPCNVGIAVVSMLFLVFSSMACLGDSRAQTAPEGTGSTEAVESGKPEAMSGGGTAVEVEGITFDPSYPVTGDSIRAVVSLAGGGKVEAEALVFHWKINGQPVVGAQSDVLDYPVKRDDFVELEVGYPGEGGTEVFVSAFVKVFNAPPTLRIAGQKLGADGNYEARIEATDPERDTVTLALKSGPRGMTLDPATGVITWPVGADIKGVYSVQVSGRDDQGAESLLDFQVKIGRETMEGGGKP